MYAFDSKVSNGFECRNSRSTLLSIDGNEVLLGKYDHFFSKLSLRFISAFQYFFDLVPYEKKNQVSSKGFFV